MLVLLLVTPVAYSLLDDLSKVRVLPRLWALTRRAAPATAAMLAIAAVLLPATARAQAAPQPVTGEVLRLNAEDAAKMAITNNPDLVAGGFDPRIGAERVAQATAAFLPTLSSGLARNVQQAPATSVFLATKASARIYGRATSRWASICRSAAEPIRSGGTRSGPTRATRCRTSIPR